MRSLSMSLVVVLGLVLLGTEGPQPLNAQKQDLGDPRQAEADEGYEPLLKGPVHEGFADPVKVDPRPNPIIPKRPPEPIEEVPPDTKPEGETVVWIAGYWGWDEVRADFIWISGAWRAVPPNTAWMPGYWNQVEDGWQWVSGYWTQQRDDVVVEYLPPPPESIDAGASTPAPSADHLYAPGSWVWQETRYFWRPGFWYVSRPNWIYVPAHYHWTPAGYVFVAGYWDYPLRERGFLFCPIHFHAAVWDRPGWFYRPRYVVNHNILLASLFVRPEFGRYYFGDYFDERYERHGFVPWFRHHMTRNTHDPLFRYYHWRYRDDWADDVRHQFVAFRNREARRPPTTIREQNQFIQNVTVNQSINTGDRIIKINNPQKFIQNMTVAAPLNQVTKFTNVKVRPVSKTEIDRERRVSQQFRASSEQRLKAEAKISGGAPLKSTDPPRRGKVDLPQLRAAVEKPTVQAPPLPQVPKSIDRKEPVKQKEPPRPIRAEPKPLPPERPPDVKAPPPKKVDEPPPPKKKVDDRPFPKKELPEPKKVAEPPPPKKKFDDRPFPKKELPEPKKVSPPPPPPKAPPDRKPPVRPPDDRPPQVKPPPPKDVIRPPDKPPPTIRPPKDDRPPVIRPPKDDKPKDVARPPAPREERPLPKPLPKFPKDDKPRPLEFEPPSVKPPPKEVVRPPAPPPPPPKSKDPRDDKKKGKDGGLSFLGAEKPKPPPPDAKPPEDKKAGKKKEKPPSDVPEGKKQPGPEGRPPPGPDVNPPPPKPKPPLSLQLERTLVCKAERATELITGDDEVRKGKYPRQDSNL